MQDYQLFPTVFCWPGQSDTPGSTTYTLHLPIFSPSASATHSRSTTLSSSEGPNAIAEAELPQWYQQSTSHAASNNSYLLYPHRAVAFFLKYHSTITALAISFDAIDVYPTVLKQDLLYASDFSGATARAGSDLLTLVAVSLSPGLKAFGQILANRSQIMVSIIPIDIAPPSASLQASGFNLAHSSLSNTAPSTHQASSPTSAPVQPNLSKNTISAPQLASGSSPGLPSDPVGVPLPVPAPQPVTQAASTRHTSKTSTYMSLPQPAPASALAAGIFSTICIEVSMAHSFITDRY